MGLKGELNTICLADIFQNMTLNSKEGTFVIEDAQSRKTFLFTNNGIFVYSEGLERTDLLGPLLVFRELLSPEQLSLFGEEVQQKKAFLEDILQDSKLMDPDLLAKIVLDCSKEEIYDLFIWKGAQFDFEEEVIFPMPLDYRQFRRLLFGNEGVNSILLEAVRRVDEWEAIFKTLPPFDEILIPANISLEELLGQDSSTQEIFPVLKSSQPIKQKVFALLNGRHTIQDVVRKSFLPRFEVCFAITHMLRNEELRSLNTMEMIYVGDYLVSRGLSAPAIHFYLRASQQGGNDPSLMSKLAYAYEQQGQMDRAQELHMNYGLFCLQNHQIEEALQSFRRVASIDPNQLEAREHIYNIYLANPTFPEANTFDFLKEGLALADAMKNFGQIEKANAYLGSCVERAPDNLSLRQKLIDAYLDSGQKENAINQYLIIAKTYQTEGNTEALVQVYEKILKINRARTDIQNKLDVIRLRKKEEQQRRKRFFIRSFLGVLMLGAFSFVAYREYQAYIHFQEDKKSVLQKSQISLFPLAQKTLKEYQSDPSNLDLLIQGFPEFKQNYEKIKAEKIQMLQSIASQYQMTLYAALLIPKEIESLTEKQEEDFTSILTQMQEILGQSLTKKIKETKQFQDQEDLELFRKALVECEDFFIHIPSAVSEPYQKELESLGKKLKSRLEEKKKQDEERERKNQEAYDVLKMSRQLEDQKKYEQAFRLMFDFLQNKDFKQTPAYEKATLPIWISINIPAEIFVNGKSFTEREFKSEYVLRLKLESSYRVEVIAEGFESFSKEYLLELLPFHLFVELKKTYLWKSEEKLGEIRGVPLFIGDKIILASFTNLYLYSFQSKTGKISWRWENDPLCDFEYGATTDEAQKNRFYASDRQGNIHCFSYPGFEHLWESRPAKNKKRISIVTPPVIISEARIPYNSSTYPGICFSIDNLLIAYAEVSNNFKLAFMIEHPNGENITSPLILTKNQQLLFFTTKDGYVRYFSFAQQKFSKGIQVAVKNSKMTPLSIDSELQILFCGTDSGQLVGISYRKGLEILWKNPPNLGGAILGKCAIANDFLYVGTEKGLLFKIFKNTGEIEWSWPKEADEKVGAFTTEICLDDLENIYAGNRDGSLYALDSRGFLKWKYKTEGEITSSPVYFDGTVYFTSKDQFFYAIRH
ncbi:MAG: PQQ-binding-like beta-propeller repeat protein [Planctomycetota bacterium]